MDFNHDYNGMNGLLVSGMAERLQLCKGAILSMGDLGYTDPGLPDIREALGDYTDTSGIDSVKSKIREILVISQVVLDSEILSIDVTSPIGDNKYVVDLRFTFGATTMELSGSTAA